MYSIIDTPNDVRRFLPRMGVVDTVIRYITTNTASEKHVKLPEVKAIAAAGKKLGLVFEVWGDFKHAGSGGVSFADGVRAGKYARTVLPKLGAPSGAAVYFAVDIEANAAQIKNNVLPYFKAIHEAFADGEYRVGVYGPGSVCKAVKEAGLCDLTWLSNAKGWSGYKMWLPQCDLLQLPVTKAFGGLDIDPDEAKSEDWGQFVPFADDASILDGEPEPEPDLGGEDVTATVTRPGQGDDSGPSATTVTTIVSTAPGLLMKAKSLWRSKIAGGAGVMGAGGAGTAVSADPQTQSLLMQLVSRPMFWMAVVFLLGMGVILYFYWRDHGKGVV